jgi:uncharacterized protein (DUF2147 family)
MHAAQAFGHGVLPVVERTLRPLPRRSKGSARRRQGDTTNLKQQGTEYSGGEILDPESGTVYRCTAKVIDSGKALEVRGYVGTPLFGRTQV